MDKTLPLGSITRLANACEANITLLGRGQMPELPLRMSGQITTIRTATLILERLADIRVDALARLMEAERRMEQLDRRIIDRQGGKDN